MATTKWARNPSSHPNIPGEKLPESDGSWPPGLPKDSGNPYCAEARIHTNQNVFTVDVNDRISILQEAHLNYSPGESADVSIDGEIRIRRLQTAQSSSSTALVTIDTYISNEQLEHETIKIWDPDRRLLNVSVPNSIPYSYLSGRNKACISLEITIWLPDDSALTMLTLGTTSLHVRVFDDAKFSVSKSTDITAISGDVIFPGSSVSLPEEYPIDSRHIVITTISGDVRGTFPLYDLLQIHSASGHLRVDLLPQSILKSAPAPAELDLSTTSGLIRVELSDKTKERIPLRNYVTRIKSTSGDIVGRYIFGSLGIFRTSSSSIKINLVPVLQDDRSSDNLGVQLETRSISGDIDVTIDDPAEAYRDMFLKNWRDLEAQHAATSARIRVSYPSLWEGTLTGESVSGRIEAKGHNLRILSRNNSWVHKSIVAKKGVADDEDGSLVKMGSISGDLIFNVSS